MLHIIEPPTIRLRGREYVHICLSIQPYKSMAQARYCAVRSFVNLDRRLLTRSISGLTID
jgi:hypothetical protein